MRDDFIFIRWEIFDFNYSSFLNEWKNIVKIINEKINWYSIKDLVILLFIKELDNIWFTKEEISKFVHLLIEKSYFEYYVGLVFGKERVNVYVFDNYIEIASVSEFIMNDWLMNYPTCVTISLNKILAKIYKRDDLLVTTSYVIDLNKKEFELLWEIRLNPNKSDINISFDDNWFMKDMEIKNKLPKELLDMINKYKELYDFGSLDIELHKKRATSWKGIQRKRFDK